MLSSDDHGARPTFFQGGLLRPALSKSDLPDGFEFSGSKFRKEYLQLESPSSVKNLAFEDCPFPLQGAQGEGSGLAYTRPFRILSDEGVAAVRAEVDRYEKFAKSNARTPKCLRGLG